MSDAIETFTFPATGQAVRTVLVDGEPWWVAADVCAVLGIGNARQAVSYLDEDEVRQAPVTTNDGSGRELPTNLVNEAGLYSLILRSRKPEAKAFKRWVTHEVLPQIRRTGSYAVAPRYEVPQTYAEALRELADTVERAERAEAELAEAKPKAESWDVLASADGDYAVADAAKILSRDPVIKLGRDRLFTVLAEQGWTYRQRSDGRWRAYQAAVERGWLSELPSSHYHPRTGDLVLDPPQVRVRTKGLHELHRRLGGIRPLDLAEQLAIGGGTA